MEEKNNNLAAEMNGEREFLTLQNEKGEDEEFELIGVTMYKEKRYFAVIPVGAAEKAQEDDNGFCEYGILREDPEEDGSVSLVSIDDDDEFDDVADLFDDMFSEEIDYD